MELINVVVTNDVTAQAKSLIQHLNSIRSPRFRHSGLYPNPRFYPMTSFTHPTASRPPGDIDLLWKIFGVLVKRLWSLFLITMPGIHEEADAKQLIYAAIHNGVSHIVLLSAAYDYHSPQTNPGLRAKLNIERFMKEQIAAQTERRISWTILRPVLCYDLVKSGAQIETFTRSCQQLTFNVQMDLVAMEDVARAAARVLGDPELYNGKNVILVGERLSFTEMNQIFREEERRDIPLAPVIRPVLEESRLNLILPVTHDINHRQENGRCRIPPSLHRAAQSNMLTFRTWVRNSNFFPLRR